MGSHNPTCGTGETNLMVSNGECADSGVSDHTHRGRLLMTDQDVDSFINVQLGLLDLSASQSEIFTPEALCRQECSSREPEGNSVISQETRSRRELSCNHSSISR